MKGMTMTHFNNAIAAYLNARDCLKQGRKLEADRYDEMAQTFCRWHVKEVGGNYLDAYLGMVAEAVGYYKKAA